MSNDKSRQKGDSEETLQDEIQKESAEGNDSVGDAGSNRNLTGASSWNTLPADADSNESKGSKNSGKKSG